MPTMSSEPLEPGLTAILYDNQQIAVLEGTVSVPVGTRVRIERTDYIVHAASLGIRPSDFDLYYDCHMAEETGADAPLM
jgi:hypothetical protein